jgi:hypothetical protein
MENRHFLSCKVQNIILKIVQLKLLTVITDIVVIRLMWSLRLRLSMFKVTCFNINYCYHMANVITCSMSQSDHIHPNVFLINSVRGGRNIENQNIKRSVRWKYFLDDQNVESQKIRMSKVKLDFQRSDLFGRHR